MMIDPQYNGDITKQKEMGRFGHTGDRKFWQHYEDQGKEKTL
jgi:hypothetical protein